jgi:hypothetical protein
MAISVKSWKVAAWLCHNIIEELLRGNRGAEKNQQKTLQSLTNKKYLLLVEGF